MYRIRIEEQVIHKKSLAAPIPDLKLPTNFVAIQKNSERFLFIIEAVCGKAGGSRRGLSSLDRGGPRLRQGWARGRAESAGREGEPGRGLCALQR